MYKETVLKNGLSVISCTMPEMSSVSVGIWISVGSRYENKKNTGISHFIEHLLFKGSQKRSCRRIKEDIEGAGGSLNGFTSEEMTCYLAKVVGEKVELALDVLSDMVLHPLFRKEDVEMERGVVREEIGRQRVLPMQYVHVMFSRLIWGGHPLGFNICGSVDTVDSVTTRDIADYKEAFYKPSNTVIAVAGKLEHEEITGIISGLFTSVN